ncbi:uncharacterized protein LOC144027587 [Festucalex cinctus]
MVALWSVLTIATHLIINSHSRRTQITGILGNDVALQFTLNTSITNSSHFAVYLVQGTNKKMAEYCPWSGCSSQRGFHIYAENSSAFCQITNPTQAHSGTYKASLFSKSKPPEESNEVHLIIREETSNSNNSREHEYRKTTNYPPSIFSSVTLTVLVVLPAVLLAAILPGFFWCCVQARAKKAQQNSSPSTQVVSVVSNNMPEADFTYSVLDFPKKDTTLLVNKTNDIEYVRVHHPPHQR